MGLILACPSGSSGSAADPTPTASDFTVSNLSQEVGKVTKVNIVSVASTPTGDITAIYYRKADGTGKSDAIPQAKGSYTISIDVAKAPGWSAVNDLVLNGVLVVNDPNSGNQDDRTPLISHYSVNGVGTVKISTFKANGVTITKVGSDVSPATPSVRYNGSATVPTGLGLYSISIYVPAASGWREWTIPWNQGLNIVSDETDIPQDKVPTEGDFKFAGLGTFTFNNTARPVTVVWRDDNQAAGITVKYGGSETAPKDAGVYAVTFDVAAKEGWLAAPQPLTAGTLTIEKATPTASLFNVDQDKLKQVFGSVVDVPITPVATADPGLSPSTVYYKNAATEEITQTAEGLAIGSYAVYYDVASTSPNWVGVTNLYAGLLIVSAVPLELEVRTITFGGDTFNYDPEVLQTRRFTGSAITPTVAVYWQGFPLTAVTHYSLVWNKDEDGADVTPATNINKGTAIGTITGLTGDYKDKTAIVKFNIGVALFPPPNGVVLNWLDKNDSIIANGLTASVWIEGFLEIKKADSASGYTVKEWRLDGVVPENASGDSFIFNENGDMSLGQHTVSLLVQNTATGMLHNRTIIITVTPWQP